MPFLWGKSGRLTSACRVTCDEAFTAEILNPFVSLLAQDLLKCLLNRIYTLYCCLHMRYRCRCDRRHGDNKFCAEEKDTEQRNVNDRKSLSIYLQ